jgi:hypothetical protein
MDMNSSAADTRGQISGARATCRRLMWPMFRRAFECLSARLAARRAEAQLRALDARALGDLGLGPGGIGHAARHGRDRD